MAVELMMDYRNTRNCTFVTKLEEKAVVQEGYLEINKSPMEIEMVADAAVTKFKKVISLLDRNRTGHARFRRAHAASSPSQISTKDFVDTKE
uniref:Uncharacterized protein LOC104238789 n=1 Tax=Nicotiana sylvestris TaxID=4096 RepID=A0A1U7XHP1_NICSY|nr:PREDICTED: uncharacterized protein LOC104238789 [Nicotiana sylvestris]